MDVVLAGDFFPNNRAVEPVLRQKESIFTSSIRKIISEADFSLLNFESPIIDGTEFKPIDKSGPSLKSTKESGAYIKSLGFDMVALANNHTSDYGIEGLRNTINVFKSLNIMTIGAGNNIEEASKIEYKKDLAVINCCENEFGIATATTAGANPLNPISQYYKIIEAKKKAKYIIVFVHGGMEHFQYPSIRMKETYRFFIDVGADAVINTHQHCFSGYEVYKSKPIFYGLGNFFFDSFDKYEKSTIWNYGYMVKLQIQQNIEFKLIPYIQCAEEPIVRLLKSTEEEVFIKEIQHINQIIGDDSELTKINKKWKDNNTNIYRFLSRPYNKIFFISWIKNIIPLYFNKKSKEILLNCIRCESHRERFVDYLLK